MHVDYGNDHSFFFVCKHSVAGDDRRAVFQMRQDIFLEFIGIVCDYPNLDRLSCRSQDVAYSYIEDQHLHNGHNKAFDIMINKERKTYRCIAEYGDQRFYVQVRSAFLYHTCNDINAAR